jgi:glycosyltransferase involved in cell wall biosynthesis
MIVACIPAYNEEKTIAKVVIGAQKYVNQVIVGDDGSDDMTAEIAESLGAIVVRHEDNLGKGAILRSLFEASLKAGASVVVTLDADGQHDPHDIPLVVRPVLDGKADLSIGARFSDKNRIPKYRRIGNKLLDVITNLRAASKVTDTQSGFRAYSRRAIEKIEVRDNGMSADSQILTSAWKNNLRITESDISVSYEGDTSTYNPLRHLSSVIYGIVRYSIERRPLLLIGLPGLAAIGIGLTYGLLLLRIYQQSHVFILAYALLAMGATLLGAFAVLVAVVLFALSDQERRLTNAWSQRGPILDQSIKSRPEASSEVVSVKFADIEDEMQDS